MMTLGGATGNLGINDSTPDGKLEVRQTAAPDIFNLYDNTTNVLTVEDGGNVGIGVTNPNSPLDMRTDSTTANMVNIERTVATVANADMLQIETHINADDNTQFLECERGSDIEFRVWGDGDVTADGTYSGPADFAEMIHVSDGAASVEPGDVMVIDINNLRSVVRATITRSTLVARVYSTKPGYLGSEHDWDKLEISLVPADLPDSEEETGMKPMALGKMIDEIPLTVVGILLLAKFPRRTARFDPATCWSPRPRPATPCATVIRRLARLWEKPWDRSAKEQV